MAKKKITAIYTRVSNRSHQHRNANHFNLLHIITLSDLPNSQKPTQHEPPLYTVVLTLKRDNFKLQRLRSRARFTASLCNALLCNVI
jgi:hypothetical protein